VELAAAHDLYVVSDEVYEDFVYEGEQVSAAQFDRDGRVIVVSGFSKSFAMTGWRLGYAIAAESLAAQIIKLQEPLVSCASSIAQKAAEAGLRGPGRVTADMRDAYAERRQLLIQALAHEGLLAAVPNGAFYALIDLTGHPPTADSAQLARDLLAREQVATAPGSTFGRQSEGLVRVSISVDPRQLEEACLRMVRYRSSQPRNPIAAAR
jgi:aspartate aminotransferase/aminotransferase